MMCMQKRYGYRAIYNHDSRAARDFAPAHLIKTKKKKEATKKSSELFGQNHASHVATSVLYLFILFMPYFL